MSYTTDLAIELMVTGTNAGTWGQVTNTNLVIIQQAIAGYQAISIAGGAQTTALAMTQSSLATARNAVLKLTGTITGNQIVTVPNGIEKTWIVSNGTTGAFTVTFKYASTGTGQTWSATDKGIKILYADQSDIQVTDLSTLSGTVATASIADSAVTAGKIAGSTITQAKLAANSVGATQITNGSVIAAKLGTTEQKQICKAWVNFNGTTSPGTIRSSYNVSSVTKNATGDYTVNFATTLADANYSVCGTGSFGASGETSGRLTINGVPSTPLTTNSARIVYVGAAFYDPSWASVQIFGN